jgi:hypothetical protein
MKSKLTLSIESTLMEEINRKAKLDKSINLSKMVEKFLEAEFKFSKQKKKSVVSSLRGILKETPETIDWKKDKEDRLTKKYL